MAFTVFLSFLLFLSLSFILGTHLLSSSSHEEDKLIGFTEDHLSLESSIHNLTNVSLHITNHLLSKKEYKNKNVVFSPLSLHVVLSILVAGSEGPTQRQLLSFLGAKSTENLNSLASYLISDVLAEGGTHNLSVANGVKLIFANALYFKGKWDEKFDASQTVDRDFHPLEGSSIKVPFMTSEKDQFISVFDGFKVLCLPYNKGEDKRQFSMCFFLPDAKDGLSSLIEKIANEPGFLQHTLSFLLET